MIKLLKEGVFMKRKTIAFYDLLLYLIICGPLIVTSAILMFFIITRGTGEWICKNWYLVIAFAVSFSVSCGGVMLFRYYETSDDAVHFHYFPFAKTWKQAAENLDIRWNQDFFISEVATVSIVKLTEEEKQTKVYYKHWFNKYLKIYLKYGSCKYVYVGNYANFQIEKMIALLEKR